nr:hypothetical protein GCM10020185_55780 [Pseudomonas brassicacearum subsp. brassicacearum]
MLRCKNRLRPLSHLPRPLEAIRQFTPNWFAVVMGTGVLALALAQWPGNVPGLRLLGEGLWLFNTLLFVVFALMYTARWVLFFDEARRIFRSFNGFDVFFGTIPMGLATIINGFFWHLGCRAGGAVWWRWLRRYGGSTWPCRWPVVC